MMKLSYNLFIVVTFTTLVSAFEITNYEEYRLAMQAANAKVTPENGILIVGGEEAPKGKYPYIAGMRSSANGRSFCAGSLISKKFILTAAHCLSWINYVSVGTHYLSGTKDGQQIKVLRKIKHPEYNKPISMANDFALLELEEDVKYINPIALAKHNGKDDEAGLMANAQGWGTTTEGGKQSDVLLHVDVPLVKNEVCHKNLTNSNPNYKVGPSMICAGGMKGKDACQGDSGGPLTVTINKESILVGVVSWGKGCAREYLPGVYSRVSYVREWIDENSKGHRWI